MNFSYWEQKQWIGQPDLVIVGAGITGLSCAWFARQLHPDWHIIVLERGFLPQGASTRNAGFACFGSLGELVDDLQTDSQDGVIELVLRRYHGLQSLLDLLGKHQLGYEALGGYELFRRKDRAALEQALSRRDEINTLLTPVIGKDVYRTWKNSFGFDHIEGILYNPYEGQLDTGKMMKALLKIVRECGVEVLFGAEVKGWQQVSGKVDIHLNSGLEFSTKRMLLATNGLAKDLLDLDLQPARAQVLLTKPLKTLPFKGSFHLDRGYYYFRNLDGRILLGGGRQLDKKGETTTEMNTTERIQADLRNLMSEVILPGQEWEVEQTWSGIMGVGRRKVPLVEQVDERVGAAVRLGGMGVALGVDTGKRAAELINSI